MPIALAVSAEVVNFRAEELKKSLKTETSSLISELVEQRFKISPRGGPAGNTESICADAGVTS